MFLVVLALVAAACQSSDGDDAPGAIACNVFHRDTPGQQFARGEVSVDVDRPGAEARVEAGRVTVRIVAGREQGTAGSLAVAVLDHDERELARGLYQFQDDVRDQFAGGHGFTGLVSWLDPATGAEVQYFCGRA